MSDLILHCGGRPASFQELCDVEIPAETRSYKPVAHRDLVELLQERLVRAYPNVEVTPSFGLNKAGTRLFGVLRVDTGESGDKGLAVGFRNSYDKSMSVGVAIGVTVFICDNLSFSGSGITVLRKHTVNVWQDVLVLTNNALQFAAKRFEQVNAELDAMKEIEIHTDLGYEVLGLAVGHGCIGWQEASVAFQDWKTPRFPEFAPRNVYSLYNCATQGLKKASATSAIAEYAGWHTFVTEHFGAQLSRIQAVKQLQLEG